MIDHHWGRVLRIDGTGVTLVLAQRGDQIPEIVHWGAALPSDEDLHALAAARRGAVSRGTLDVLSPQSILPEEGRSYQGTPGIEMTSPDGARWLTALCVSRIEAGPDRVCIDAADKGVEVRLDFGFDGSLLVASTTLTNGGSTPIHVFRLASPALPISDQSDRLATFGGHWIGEFRETVFSLGPGKLVRQARTGRTSQEDFPAALSLTPGATFNEGEVAGFHLGWSGGHEMVAEELADGRRQIQFAPLIRPGEIVLQPGESFSTPRLYGAYSRTGRSGIAQVFQGALRKTVGHQHRPRPIICNCWEAVYFDHNLNALKSLAEDAAALGAERFVLDDGWFGARDDDTTSLGDWTTHPQKWPDGLWPLVHHVQDLGMSFGLWLEPEMVSEDSDLFRSHPDWRLGDPEYPQISGRNQYVLDLGRQDVIDYLFESIDELLRTYPITYVKLDHNRHLSAASGADGRPGVVRQTAGLYALLDRLIATHPKVEFESCASGGGRIDFGILSRAGRVWLSDSNDALERMRMQSVAALFLPAEVVGSHVGPRVSHTSLRSLGMATRAWTAATRQMGLEFSLSELTGDERDTLKRAIDWHKKHRELLHSGIFYYLDPLEPDAYGELTASEDGDKFVAFFSFTKAPARASTRPIRLTGLDGTAHYRIRLINKEMITPLSRVYSSPLVGEDGVVLTGSALMTAGIQLPIHVPATVFVLEGERQ
ncbi:MAG: alpha-galactosidase [Pseudomonadota bacterium]